MLSAPVIYEDKHDLAIMQFMHKLEGCVNVLPPSLKTEFVAWWQEKGRGASFWDVYELSHSASLNHKVQAAQAQMASYGNIEMAPYRWIESPAGADLATKLRNFLQEMPGIGKVKTSLILDSTGFSFSRQEFLFGSTLLERWESFVYYLLEKPERFANLYAPASEHKALFNSLLDPTLKTNKVKLFSHREIQQLRELISSWV